MHTITQAKIVNVLVNGITIWLYSKRWYSLGARDLRDVTWVSFLSLLLPAPSPGALTVFLSFPFSLDCEGPHESIWVECISVCPSTCPSNMILIRNKLVIWGRKQHRRIGQGNWIQRIPTVRKIQVTCFPAPGPPSSSTVETTHAIPVGRASWCGVEPVIRQTLWASSSFSPLQFLVSTQARHPPLHLPTCNGNTCLGESKAS